MAERADVAAHRAVVLAARERQEAARALATLSATHDELDHTRAQVELEKKIAQLQEEYKGVANALGPGGCTPLLLVCVQGRVDDVTACSRCRRCHRR